MSGPDCVGVTIVGRPVGRPVGNALGVENWNKGVTVASDAVVGTPPSTSWVGDRVGPGLGGFFQM